VPERPSLSNHINSLIPFGIGQFAASEVRKPGVFTARAFLFVFFADQ
jgi:hypothetical protein